MSSIAGEQEDFTQLEVEPKSFHKMHSFPRVSNPLVRQYSVQHTRVFVRVKSRQIHSTCLDTVFHNQQKVTLGHRYHVSAGCTADSKDFRNDTET